jgi:hypothetical protein
MENTTLCHIIQSSFSVAKVVKNESLYFMYSSIMCEIFHQSLEGEAAGTNPNQAGRKNIILMGLGKNYSLSLLHTISHM